MSIMNFTVEETNLIAMYDAGTLAATLMRIADALPDMDADMAAIAISANRKLAALTEEIYGETAFIPADEDEGDAYV